MESSTLEETSKEAGNEEPPRPGLFDLTDFDTSIELRQNFYLWANGGWLRKKKKLPDQKNDSSGILEDARIRVQKDLQDIMDRLTTADRNSLSEREKKILDFYHASTNTAIIEGKGLSEFLPVIETCRRINEDPSGVLAELHSKYGVNTLFCLRSMIDRKKSDNTKCSLFLDTTRGFYKDFEHMAGLGLNDYHDDGAKILAHDTHTHFPEGMDELDKYEILIHRAFDILGSYDIVRYKSTEYNKSLAREIVKLQIELSTKDEPVESRVDPLRTYNIFEVDGLQELTKRAPITRGAYLAFGPVDIQDFNWRSYFEKCGQDPDAMGDIIVEQPQALSMLNFALKTSYIVDYLVLQCFESFSPHMTSKTQNWAQDLHNMLGSSASIVKTNSESSVRLVDMYFGETLGEIYREKNYDPRIIEIVRDMSNRLKLELHDSLNRCHWFEEKTRLAALEKLAALEVQIWGPSKLCNKELEFNINRDDHFANIIECRRSIFKHELGLMNQPTDRELWLSSPQTVNAFYLPSLNRVTIPAGILQYPLFDVNSDTAVHYGSLGKIIAHEMAHAFDDFGRMFDFNGNVRNWWSPKDEVAYHERILSKLSSQLAGLRPVIKDKQRHSLLCGECLADLWSLKLVVGVLKSIYAEATPEYQNKRIDGLDFWERFFIIGWAHSWREGGSPSTHVWMHAIPEVRCNMPLMNLPEFAEKFKLTEFNTMFLEPDKRVDFYC